MLLLVLTKNYVKIPTDYQTNNNNNSPIQEYVHPDDQTQPTFYIITCNEFEGKLQQLIIVLTVVFNLPHSPLFSSLIHLFYLLNIWFPSSTNTSTFLLFSYHHHNDIFVVLSLSITNYRPHIDLSYDPTSTYNKKRRRRDNNKMWQWQRHCGENKINVVVVVVVARRNNRNEVVVVTMMGKPNKCGGGERKTIEIWWRW